MVNILIRFFLYLRKLAKGNVLDSGELNVIKAYLGYEFNANIAIPFTIFAILGLISVIFFILNNIILGLTILLLAIIGMLYFSPLLKKLNRKLYIKSLEDFLSNKLYPYRDKKILYIYYKIHSAYDINKDSIYFLYDDYYFVIMEDLLAKEKIGKKVFKYPDANSLNKKPLIFKLGDIVSYNISEDSNLKCNSISDLILLDVKFDKISQINLKRFKSIILGNEAGLAIKQIIPDLRENSIYLG